ncbi:MAG: hypothetical protein V4612_02860 [Pseudomonadota bacterium]
MQQSSQIINPTHFRNNLFSIIDKVVKTGKDSFVMRNNALIKLSLEERKYSKTIDLFSKLKVRENVMNVKKPDDLINLKLPQWDQEKNKI